MYAYSATLGGETTVIATLTRALRKRGWEVDLVTRLTTPYEYPLDDGPHIVRLKRPLSLGLTNYIRTRKPRVLMSFDEIPNTEAITARMLARGPERLIIRYDCPLYTPYYPVKWRYRLGIRTRTRRFLLRHFMMDRADAVIAVSEGIRNSINATYPNVSVPVRRLYNPLDIEYIRSRMLEDNPHPWLGGDVPAIVSICRLDPEKDLFTMLRAFELALRERDLRLIVVGDGVLSDELKREAYSLNIEDNVCFTGYVENQYSYMAHADVFAMSSYAEGLGCTLQEALICGTTIVSTDYDYGASELLEQGKYGTLVPIMDPEAMARAFLDAVDNQRDPALLAEKAQEFDVETHVDALLALVDDPAALANCRC